jgi:hypothetical protein
LACWVLVASNGTKTRVHAWNFEAWSFCDWPEIIKWTIKKVLARLLGARNGNRGLRGSACSGTALIKLRNGQLDTSAGHAYALTTEDELERRERERGCPGDSR